MPNSTIENPIIWNVFKKGDIDDYKILYHQHVGYLLNYGLRLYTSMTVVEDSV